MEMSDVASQVTNTYIYLEAAFSCPPERAVYDQLIYVSELGYSGNND